MKSTRLFVPLVALGLLAGTLGACGGDDSSAAPSDCTEVTGTEFAFVAVNIQWNTECLKVPANTTIHFTVDNKDVGVKHDLQISGQGEKRKTELEAGPVTQELTFDFGEGYYQFVCSLHANMEGDIFAE